MTDNPESDKPKPPPSIQARMSESDPRLYNVNRDVAHNFVRVANLVAARMEEAAWPELNDLLELHEVTQDELGESCQAFCLFVGTSAEDPDATMEEALTRSGWFKVRPEAQLAAMGYLGTVVLGLHFAGVREATLGGEGPAEDLKSVVAHGEECSRLISMPRWKRRLNRIVSKVRRIWSAVKG